MAYKLGFSRHPLPVEWTKFLSSCDACRFLRDDGCGDCASCSSRWIAWQKRIMANRCRHIPNLSGASQMATLTFPTTPGLYWAQIPSAGPPPPNTPPAYNAIAVLSGDAPFMRLGVLPLSGQAQPGRVWQPNDLLAIGPAVAIPALAGE